MEMMQVIGIILIIWAGNALTSYLHWKKINNKLLDLKRNYTGYLGTSTNKVNFFRKVLLIIVTDPSGTITECQYLYGWTTFARFRQKKDWIGFSLDSLLDEYRNDKFFSAIEGSATQIKQQIGGAVA